MHSGYLKDLIISALILGLGYAAIFALNQRLESVKPPLPKGYEDADLTVEGGRLRGYSFGAEGLVADWYWMRALQYLGTKIVNAGEGPGIKDLRPLNPRLLYPMLDNASTLDPRFMTVYSYGAMVLPEIDVQQAIRLTEKGIEHNPEEWKLYHFLGYIYWQQDDFAKAAEIYEKGSKLPGARNWMQMMAVNMRTEGSSRATARQIYTQIYNEAQDDETRNYATARLLGLDAQDDLDVINQVLVSYRSDAGRCPASWQELTPWLKTHQIPQLSRLRVNRDGAFVDPTDMPYVLDSEKCVSALDPANTRIAVK